MAAHLSTTSIRSSAAAAAAVAAVARRRLVVVQEVGQVTPSSCSTVRQARAACSSSAARTGAALAAQETPLTAVAARLSAAPLAPPLQPTRPACQLQIVYGDAGLIVVNKPSGLLSVPGIGPEKEARNAATLAQAWCREHPAAVAALIGTPSAFRQIAALAAHGEATTSAASMAGVVAALGADAARTGTHKASKVRRRALAGGALPYVATSAALAWWRDETARGGADSHASFGNLAPGALLRELEVAPRVVHRLDEATSGALLFGLTPAMQRALSIQFIAHAVRKVYEAVVDVRWLHGWAAASPLATADAGEINTPLQPRCHAPLWHPVTHAFHDTAAPAHTSWRVLARTPTTVRLALMPTTGRTHQLRLHCALPPPWGLGAPIVGDPFYHAACALPADATATFRDTLVSDSAAHGADTFPWLSTAHLLFGPSACASPHVPPLPAAPAPADDSPAGAACAAPTRLLLHAAEVHIVDAFNYAAKLVGSAPVPADGSGGDDTPVAPPPPPPPPYASTYGDVTVSWAPAAAAVRTYLRTVDDHGSGHAVPRRVVAIRIPPPF